MLFCVSLLGGPLILFTYCWQLSENCKTLCFLHVWKIIYTSEYVQVETQAAIMGDIQNSALASCHSQDLHPNQFH